MLPERQHFMHTTIKAARVHVLASEGMPQERERPAGALTAASETVETLEYLHASSCYSVSEFVMLHI